MASLDDRIARHEAELERLNAKKAAREKREAELNERLRTYAGMTLAGAIWKEFGCTYDTFDIEAFMAQLRKCHGRNWKMNDGSEIPMFDCKAEKAERKIVRQRYRDYLKK